jgi:hypothetical protein
VEPVRGERRRSHRNTITLRQTSSPREKSLRAHRELLAPVGVAATAVLAVGAVAQGASEHSPQQRVQSLSLATDATADPVDPLALANCPTEDEMDVHWEQYGRDLKPSLVCSELWDADDALPSDPVRPPEADQLDPQDLPTTLVEAQVLYDPEDDPWVLVGRNPDGPDFVVIDSAIGFGPSPPDWVKTPDDFAEWLPALDGGTRQ